MNTDDTLSYIGILYIEDFTDQDAALYREFPDKRSGVTYALIYSAWLSKASDGAMSAEGDARSWQRLPIFLKWNIMHVCQYKASSMADVSRPKKPIRKPSYKYPAKVAMHDMRNCLKV